MKKYFLLAVSLMFLVLCQAQLTYKLSFKPANGGRYEASTSLKTRIFQNIMGQEIETSMDYDMNLNYDIEADGDNKKLNMTYDKIQMVMDVMGQQITMNSEDPDDGEASKAASATFQALKGKTISVTLTPGGKVVKIDGTEEIINSAADDEMQKKMLEGILGEDAMSSLLSQSFGFYPDKPVKAGDSWSSSMSLKSPYSITANNTYTLTKVEGKKAYINIAGTLKTDSSSTMKINGIELNIDITGDITGTSEVDIDTGMPMVTTSTQTLKGNVQMQGQKIPLTSKIDAEMRVIKK